MKNLITFLLCFAFSGSLFSQDLPIPRKEQIIENFGEQLITYSKKKKSINIHYRDNKGIVRTFSLDYSKVTKLKNVVKNFNETIREEITKPEVAIERFKIYKLENAIHLTIEFRKKHIHYTDLITLNLETKEITRKKYSSAPTEAVGYSNRTKGASTIYDNKLFQTFFNGMNYGLAIHDLQDSTISNSYYNTVNDTIDFKNSFPIFTRDVVGFTINSNLWDKKKQVKEVNLFRRLERDKPFICVAKNEGRYLVWMGAYNKEEYDTFLFGTSIPGVGTIKNKPIPKSTKEAISNIFSNGFTTYSRNSISFFSLIDINNLTHIKPN